LRNDIIKSGQQIRLGLCVLLYVSLSSLTAAQTSALRPVTITDVVQMTQFVDQSHVSDAGVVQPSPDGDKFVIVVKRGNLQQNTNDYSLLLFDVHNSLHQSRPKQLAEFSSDSSRPGIEEIKWLNNRIISFVGERQGQLPQLYTVDTSTKQLTRLTGYRTGLLNYSMRSDGQVIAFLAEPDTNTLLTNGSLKTGILVSDQTLPDLCSQVRHLHSQLFVLRGAGGLPSKIDIPNLLPAQPGLPFSMSPDGRHLVIEAYANTVPEAWRQYDNADLQQLMNENAKGGKDFYDIGILLLIDVVTGRSKPLIDAPIMGQPQVAWSPKGNSVVTAGTYLPLSEDGSLGLAARKSKMFVAEVDISNGKIAPITSRNLKLLRWDARSGLLMLQEVANGTSVNIAGRLVNYKRNDSGWEEVTAERFGLRNGMTVKITQDLNTPPRLAVFDPRMSEQVLEYDPNPQFKNLKFGTVQEITFVSSGGRRITGGLFYPSSYQSGKRYPLVIQTHGWDGRQFWIDGPYSTGFIAQPLTGKQMFVLQLERELPKLYSAAEGELEMQTYEGAIDYLDRQGLIDRNRVGLIGFSRTDYHVKYTLTHSAYKFAAASTADGFDGGYFQYMTFANASPSYAASFEMANGAAPFGAGLSMWLQQSPGFTLVNVRTPVRLIANGKESIFDEWEWFSGLSRLGKPVEMIYLPEAAHVLIKPAERMIAQGGNVEWFDFWLNGEEDAESINPEQYSRWRTMRDLDKNRASQ
jgi:dipeptidyl aminopeptidase/acylaminoacyl peptidase